VLLLVITPIALVLQILVLIILAGTSPSTDTAAGSKLKQKIRTKIVFCEAVCGDLEG
jgi:hypothetical protein